MVEKNIKEIATAINEFGLDLYQKIRNKNENIFFSPFSIHTCLIMAYAGARENTAAEMEKVFHLTLKGKSLHPTYKALLDTIKAQSIKKEIELHVANSLWVKMGLTILESYLRIINDNYGKNIFELVSSSTINGWVSEQTRGKISKIMENLDQNLKLIIINAIYFKAFWEIPFKKELTTDQPFTLINEQKITVPMMHSINIFYYLEGPDFQFLGIPYKEKKMSMIIILPNSTKDLEKLEAKLTMKEITEMINGADEKRVEVYLPKFELNTGYSLKNILQSMGMVEAFSDEADFSGLTGNKDLRIDEVIHKGFVDVNEEGTEAAAVTATPMAPVGAPPPKPSVFRADHPFIFLIRDHVTRSFLFIGRVSNPKP